MKIESFNNDKHLTYEELVEYSRGNLSNSEMHRLEQHLIGCGLCNEALEGVKLLGYEGAGSSIERIKQTTGAGESKGLGLYHYIGIAASIILIATLGFLFIRNGEQADLVAERIPEAKEALDEETLDPVQGEPDQLASVDTTEESATNTEYLAMNQAPLEEDISTPIETPPQRSAAEADTEAIVAVQPAAAEQGVGNELVLAELDISAVDSTAGVTTDSALMALNEVAEEEEAAAARTRMAAPGEAITTEAKKTSATDEVSGEYVLAQPSKGMRSFERYLKRNLDYPQEAKNNAIEGDVVLQITINADGSFGEITVTTSLGYGCDEEAIRLLREGPSWEAATRGGVNVVDQVSVTVSFKL